MQRLKLFITSGTLFLLPVIASAQDGILKGGNGGDGTKALGGIVSFINNTLVPFILAIAFLVFVWGVFSYFILGASNEDKRKDATKVMAYSVGGFVLIMVFWGIVNILVSFVGLGGEGLKDGSIPKAATPSNSGLSK